MITRGAGQVRQRAIAALQSPVESHSCRAICLLGQDMITRSLGAVLHSDRFDHRVTIGLAGRKRQR
jgi:hypothetical protein